MVDNEAIAALAGGIGAGIGIGVTRLVPVEGVVGLLTAAVTGAIIAVIAFYILSSVAT